MSGTTAKKPAAKRAASKRAAAAKPSVIEKPFDPSADDDMAETVAELALRAQRQINATKALAVANEHSLDDVMPNPNAEPLRNEDGTIKFVDGQPVFPTYRDDITKNQDAMGRLKEAYADIWPVVEHVLERRKRQLREAREQELAATATSEEKPA